jgi:hypothetical protein
MLSMAFLADACLSLADWRVEPSVKVSQVLVGVDEPRRPADDRAVSVLL